MNHPLNSRQRGFDILSISISTHGARNLLWIISTNRNLKYWGNLIYLNYSNSLYRICITVRSNKILRRYSNYKFILGYSIYWKNTCGMNVRWICSRQCHIKSLFCNPFHFTLYHHCNSNHSLTVSPPNRIKQPSWN